jgi:hypothetical protein
VKPLFSRSVPLPRFGRPREQLPQQVGQSVGLFVVEGGQGLRLDGQAGADRLVDDVQPLLGERDLQAAAVVRIGGAAQQVGPFQFVSISVAESWRGERV